MAKINEIKLKEKRNKKWKNKWIERLRRENISSETKKLLMNI